MTTVDARFAGGAIFVERDTEYLGDDTPGVRVELPGHAVWLFPREARALATALTEHATVEEPRNVRREADADDYFRVVEDGFAE